jgi:DNA-binding transcriptional LysR family regulator
MNKFDDQQPELADLKAVMALMEHGTVTRAAQTLGTSQSALSYQLDRMRKRFGDALFVRIGNRMAATPFTQRLAEPAARVLRIMETEIGGLQSFDASTTTREFRVGMNELGAITLVPRLVRRLAEVAPHAMISPIQLGSETLSAALESGQLDMAIGFFATSDPRLFQQRLYQRDYVCIARRDHPQVGQSLSWQAFSLARKVHTSAIPITTGWLETQLRKASFAPNVTMGIQHIAAIPFIVNASDMVAIVPRELYELFSPLLELKTVRLPKAIPAITIRQYWHPRIASDPSVKFFRELVYAVAREPAFTPAQSNLSRPRLIK